MLVACIGAGARFVVRAGDSLEDNVRTIEFKLSLIRCTRPEYWSYHQHSYSSPWCCWNLLKHGNPFRDYLYPEAYFIILPQFSWTYKKLTQFWQILDELIFMSHFTVLYLVKLRQVRSWQYKLYNLSIFNFQKIMYLT